MKCRVFKLFIDFGSLHKEVELLTSLLCLCVGNFSSVDNFCFKTNRVANGALFVFRTSLNTCMMDIGLMKISLSLRVLSCLLVVIVYEVRFYAPSLYIFASSIQIVVFCQKKKFIFSLHYL